MGLPYIDDANSPEHPPLGCSLLHFTRDKNEHRHSTYHAFLPKELAIERQSNLHIATNTIVERLQVERLLNGRCIARGVDLLSSRQSKRTSVRAGREIILCAGPFGSPHVLLLR